ANQATTVGTALIFNGSGSAYDGAAILGYSWSFGDGTSASGSSVSQSYAVAGTFTVTLTINDSFGAAGSASTTVTVSSQSISTPGTALWATNVGGPYGDVASCVAVDSLGNIYAAGSKNEWGGTKNPYVVKLSPAGTVVWSQIYYAAQADSTFTAIALDRSGNVLLTGNYSGQIDFG